jgi:hypothetical protein
LALNTNQSIDKLRQGHDIAKILLKLALNTIQPTNQSINPLIKGKPFYG